MKKEFEQKRIQLVESYEAQLREFKEKEGILKNFKQELTEKKFELDHALKETQNQLKLTEKELSMITREVETLRVDNKSLDQIKFTQEKKITELTIQIQSLERQIKDKESMIENNRSLADTSNSQNVRKYTTS